MKTDDLLAILDMTEDEQEKALWQIYSPDYYCCLADLAFRLRDEADPMKLANSIALVYIGVRLGKAKPTAEALLGWLIKGAKPIHWIIAALIAKGEK